MVTKLTTGNEATATRRDALKAAAAVAAASTIGVTLPDTAAAQPEVLGHHAEEAGMIPAEGGELVAGDVDVLALEPPDQLADEVRMGDRPPRGRPLRGRERGQVLAGTADPTGMDHQHGRALGGHGETSERV